MQPKNWLVYPIGHSRHHLTCHNIWQFVKLPCDVTKHKFRLNEQRLILKVRTYLNLNAEVCDSVKHDFFLAVLNKEALCGKHIGVFNLTVFALEFWAHWLMRVAFQNV
jgi:hypothetical protein